MFRVSGMFMISGIFMVSGMFMVSEMLMVHGMFILIVVLLCIIGVNSLDLGPTPYIPRKPLFIPDFATAIFSICFFVIKQRFSLLYLSSRRQVTYHSSIAIANVWLAPVDEETSSVAQEVSSDAGRQWKKGELSCVLQTIQGCAHWEKYRLSTMDRRRKCNGLWELVWSLQMKGNSHCQRRPCSLTVWDDTVGSE